MLAVRGWAGWLGRGALPPLHARLTMLPLICAHLCVRGLTGW